LQKDPLADFAGKRTVTQLDALSGQQRLTESPVPIKNT
ncbi:unnamed protein product, partial [Urochloa humidicola]